MRHLISRPLLFCVFTALPLLQACSDEPADRNPSARSGDARVVSATEAVPAGLARADFDVEGMDCGGCVIGTRAALRKLDGVRTADATYDDATGRGTAWALYDPAEVSPERMMAAIRQLGYTPTPVQIRS